MASRSSLIIVPAAAQTVEQRIERVERQFRHAERMAGIGTWRLVLAENRCEWSGQVFAIHGVPLGTAPSLDEALDFYPPADRKLVADAIVRTLATGEPYTLETDLITASGGRRRVRSMGEIELANGAPVGLIGVLQDISEHHAMLERLRHAAATDDLTGLANRGAFLRHLRERIIAHRSNASPLALLLIDLDGFKAVNDAFGHLAGDNVLREVADELKSIGEQDCFAARLGGDEFAVVVNCDSGGAHDAIAVRLLSDLRRRVRYDGKVVGVSASIGVATLCDAVETPTDLIARADAALYEAKRNRRGSARVFGGDDFIACDPRQPLKSVA